MVVHFAPGVDVIAGDVAEIELFFIEHFPFYFPLGRIVAHNFHQDRAVAVQDFIRLLYGFGGGFAEADVIGIFTG